MEGNHFISEEAPEVVAPAWPPLSAGFAASHKLLARLEAQQSSPSAGPRMIR